MSTATYPVTTIAKLLILTPRWVQHLAREGVIPKSERGRYELVPAVQGYIRYLRDRAIGADLPDGGGDHKIRLLKARADIAEYEAERMAGELAPVDEVEKSGPPWYRGSASGRSPSRRRRRRWWRSKPI